MTDNDERKGSIPYEGESRAAPYPLSRLSAPVSLVDAAREIQAADQWLAATASAQLGAIAEQMQHLREQAEKILHKAQQDALLHRAEARFTRIPGKIYHLYARADGTQYWSLLAPSDWNGTPPHSFVGSFRLEADRSWTRADQIEPQDAARGDISEWLKKKLLP
jgi:hypothetical protein